MAAARLCALSLNTAKPVLVRGFSTNSCLFLSRSAPLLKVETMKQVDVDDAAIQKKMGTISMDFVRKAEKKNKTRAKMHRFFRRTDWMIAGFCFSLVVGIYGYTMFAIKQEKFLDDFDMPEEIDRTVEDEQKN